MSARQSQGRHEICFRVQQIDCGDGSSVRNVELPSGEEFIEIPGAAAQGSGRTEAHKGRHGFGWNRVVNPLKNEEIKIFVAERKSEMIVKIVTWPVSFVEYVPSAFLTAASLDVV